MLGHSMGTLRTFVQTSAQIAVAFRGVWGCSPRNFVASQVRSEATFFFFSYRKKNHFPQAEYTGYKANTKK